MENTDLIFDAVFQWKMKPPEIEVFKLAVTYEREYTKLFADSKDGTSYKKNTVPRTGDPRKSNLFRQLWKLARETRGLLEAHEYKNYIHANLMIVKLHKGHVEPNIVCGDKAWVRYKVWKRKFDVMMSEAGAVAPPPSVTSTSPKIIGEIDRTKKFLFEKCEGSPTFDKVKAFIDAGIFKFWVASAKVSPYYVALSPYVARAGAATQLFAVCSSSESVFREKLTTEVKNYFEYEFTHEYV